MRWLESLARGFPWAVKQALPTQPLAWPEEPGVGLGTFLGPNPQGMGSLCTPVLSAYVNCLTHTRPVRDIIIIISILQMWKLRPREVTSVTSFSLTLKLFRNIYSRGFPGGPVVKTPHQYRGRGFDPWSGNSAPTCWGGGGGHGVELGAWPKKKKQPSVLSSLTF